MSRLLARATAFESQKELTLAAIIHERQNWKERVHDHVNRFDSVRNVAESSVQTLKAANERTVLQLATLRRCNDPLEAQLKERDADVTQPVSRVTAADAENVPMKVLSVRYFARSGENTSCTPPL